MMSPWLPWPVMKPITNISKSCYCSHLLGSISFSLFIVLVSYVFILFAILRIKPAESRKKAFSTCASHLTSITIFYGLIIFMYMQPETSHSLHTDKISSVFYIVVIPMLNPLIYSLRNKEVKNTLKRTMEKMYSTII